MSFEIREGNNIWVTLTEEQIKERKEALIHNLFTQPGATEDAVADARLFENGTVTWLDTLIQGSRALKERGGTLEYLTVGMGMRDIELFTCALAAFLSLGATTGGVQ